MINEVFILFLIMFAGFIARRQGLISSLLNKGLAELLLNVTMPFMILGAFSFKLDAAVVTMAGQIFLFSCFLHAGMFFASRWLFGKYHGETKKVLRFTATFSNCAFMGYPVLQGIYGKPGVFFASIFVVPFIVGLWTAGVLIFNDKQEKRLGWRNVLFNPGILAVLCGVFIFLFNVKLPEPIARACDLLGSTTTPLAMVLIGSSLAEVRLRDILSGGSVYYAALIRLLVIPLFSLGVLLLCGVKGMALGVCVIASAMPAAANTAAFAESYGSDTVLASRCVFVSTLASIVSIPLFIWIVKHFI